MEEKEEEEESAGTSASLTRSDVNASDLGFPIARIILAAEYE